MAAINFPNSPTLNEIYLAENGLNYQWDGEKWVVYVAPSQSVNYWTRDAASQTVSLINAGDNLSIEDSSNVEKFSVDAATGDTEVGGTLSFEHIDIDGLTLLP